MILQNHGILHDLNIYDNILTYSNNEIFFLLKLGTHLCLFVSEILIRELLSSHYIYELRCDLNLQANFLTRVHHKNLTSFVGYCDENTNMGLIYEYMANGNLARHLSGIDHAKNLSL
jgi:hypothetical protein